jgi:hypothetical protein
MKNKPKVPEEVFVDGKLYYTIVDYRWIPPGIPFLKSGWFPLKEFNTKHPIMVKKLEEIRKASEICLERKWVNEERLRRIVITI